MTRTGNDAIAWARDHMRWSEGYCLQWVRSCFDVGSRDPDAATAWRNAFGRHPVNSGDHCPRAVPIYWTGGSRGYGHIALSVGNGNCISTDAGGSGVCAKVSIDGLTRAWGQNFMGWAESVNGVRVFQAKPKPPAPGWERVRVSVLRPGHKNKDIEVVKRRLIQKVGNDYHMDMNEPQLWGPAVTKTYAKWQRRLGYSGHDANGLPGTKSLRRLGLTVVD